MSENPYKVKPNDGNGCMVHAGILTPHGGDVSKAELTSGYSSAAKDRFIKEVVERLTFKVPLPFPCGLEIEPLPSDQSDLLQDLADEKAYPDFHANVLGHYRDMARQLESQSEFNLLPICDPIALGFKLGVDIKIPELPDFMQFAMPNIPALAAKLEMPPLELALKIPDLIPVPKLPEFKWDVPFPPAAFFDLWEFRGFTVPPIELPLPPQLRFAGFIADLILKIPDFMIKLISLDLPDFLGEICKLARESLFAKQSSDKDGIPQDVVRIVATEVLARKVIEMSLVHAMAKTIGTSPSGLVGQYGTYSGYGVPVLSVPESNETPEQRVRRIISDEAKAASGLCWSNDAEKDQDDRPYTDFIFPKETAGSYWDREGAYKAAEQMSSCGLVARTCLARAGAVYVFDLNTAFAQSVIWGSNKPSIHTTPQGTKMVYNYFDDYYCGGAVSALVAVAKRRGALIAPSYVTNDSVWWPGDHKIYELPDLKKGDIILIGNPGKNDDHVMVVVEDYKKGGDELVCVHGGQNDQGNVGTASYLKPPQKYQVTYRKKFEKQTIQIGVNANGDPITSEQEVQTGVEKISENKIVKGQPPPQPPDVEQTSSQQTSSEQINSVDASIITTTTEKPRKGIRCTGIQTIKIYTEEGLKKRGLQVRPAGNMMGEVGIGLMVKVADAGVAGKNVVAFGSGNTRTVKLLMDGAKMVLGTRDSLDDESEKDTTQVGKNYGSSTEQLLPQSENSPAVDNNDESHTGTPYEIPLELQLARAKELEGKKKALKDQKKKELKDKNAAAAAKREQKVKQQ